jgi:outer membrane protein insertion porin family
LPLRRAGAGIYALDAYVNVGLYALTDRRNLGVAIPGYDGLSAIPVDLTFDIGLRADTDIGLFQFGFSNILGFMKP